MIGDLLIQDSNDLRFIYLFENGNFTSIQQLLGDNKIRNPNSNAFIDLDNDFIADLFIEDENGYEYFYLKPLTKLPNNEFIKRIFAPDDATIGSSTFIDYNSDGVIDHLVPVCKDYGCAKGSSIVVWKQEELSFIRIASKFTDPDNPKKHLCFVKEFNEQQLIIPMKLRHGDVDGDGYIDLLALMTDCSNPDKERSIYILKNVADKTERTFKVFSKIKPKYKEEKESSSTQVILASFIDLAEDGSPDFIVLSKQQDGKFIINTIINENFFDACFFKVMVISGRCYDEDCGKKSTDKIKNPFTNEIVIGYGTNQAGSAISFELVDSEGKQRTSCSGQLSQTSDLALQTPYNIFGLGTLPNFVDLLTASLPINYTSTLVDDKSNLRRIQSWTQIVPDSNLKIIPHPIEIPSEWKVKLFLTPSDIIFKTLYTLTSICIMLIVIIGVLHRKEMLEDVKEQAEFKKQWPEFKR